MPYFDKSIRKKRCCSFALRDFSLSFPNFIYTRPLFPPLFADIKEEEKGQRIFTAAAFLPFPLFFSSLSDPFSISSSLFSRRR